MKPFAGVCGSRILEMAVMNLIMAVTLCGFIALNKLTNMLELKFSCCRWTTREAKIDLKFLQHDFEACLMMTLAH